MANTSVSICSNALVKLGDDPITSLSDNTNRARHCNRLFEPARQAVLRDAPWNDSTTRARLAQSSDAPEWEFDYKYALPSNYMRMLKTSLDEDDLEYKIEGRYLLTDETEVYITYVYDNADVASYDPLHVEALTAKMAYELANAITAKVSLSDRMEKEYVGKISIAKAVDGQEGSQDTNDYSPLTDVR